MIETSRRRFLSGMVGIIAAPAIIRVTSLMPVKAFVDDAAIAKYLSDAMDKMIRPPIVCTSIDMEFLTQQFFLIGGDMAWRQSLFATLPNECQALISTRSRVERMSRWIEEERINPSRATDRVRLPVGALTAGSKRA